MSVSGCSCADWRENIEHVEGPILSQALRAGTKGYSGKPFTHCPWCGAQLAATSEPEEEEEDA